MLASDAGATFQMPTAHVPTALPARLGKSDAVKAVPQRPGAQQTTGAN